MTNQMLEKNAQIIELFKPMVGFLGAVLGDKTEVVLHDCQNPDTSVIAIHNGHLSGRTVGSPMTNLLVRMLKSSDGQDYLDKYHATGPSGKEFYSFTYFIKNDTEETIGALCINRDVDIQKDLFQFLGKQYGLFDRMGSENGVFREVLSSKSADSIQELINEAMARTGITNGNMSVEEKKKLVGTLYELGAFEYKSSVPQVSKFLKVSEPTTYRYIAQVKPCDNVEEEK